MTPRPMPLASQKAMAASTAASPVIDARRRPPGSRYSTGSPFGGTIGLAADRAAEPGAAKTSITGSPYLRAKSRSRWSCAGQPKMAPVP